MADTARELVALVQRRVIFLLFVGLAMLVAYLLRGVIFQLFFAFLIAYALDPAVDHLERWKVPRAIGALVVLLGLLSVVSLALMYAIPVFVDELRLAARDLPKQLQSLEQRAAPWLWTNFKIRIPMSFGELGATLRTRFQSEGPTTLAGVVAALFGTLGYLAVVLSALIVPVFSLYLLIDFDRIVARAGALVPRRWSPSVREFASDVHHTLGSYVRGQITANFVLASLYALGLYFTGIRLAVPIGILTGMLAFVPYIGFLLGLTLAISMAVLDWQGLAVLLQVIAVMAGVQVLDALVITPRIVGKSVGLSPLEVLLTMMAAGSLFGFFGVLFAVPLGAVVKIAAERLVQGYLSSDFYNRARSTV